MNAKISAFVICVQAIIYLLLYNLHDCTLKKEAEKFGQQSKKLDSGSMRLEHLQDPNDVCQSVIALYSLIFWF